MRKPSDVIEALLLLSISAYAVTGGIKLNVGKVSEPQPGFFPFWGGVVLAVLSFILFIQAWTGRSKGAVPFGAIWRPMIMVIGLIAYVAVLNTVGYLIATLVLSVVLLRVLETKKWWVLGLASLCIASGSYILFDRLLNVSLPVGILSGFL
jgi:putative tricarboxylic transport membrane protein